MVAERGGRARFVASDIADVATHEALLDIVYAEFGRLDCLVNNAGVMCVRGDLLEATPDDFDRVIGVNLKGTFFLTQAAARRMIAEEAKREGRTIVTISSANTVMVSPEKSLLLHLQVGAVRWSSRCSACASPRTASPASRSGRASSAPRCRRRSASKFTAMIEAGATPIRRWGEAADVGKTVVSLATGALPYSVGQPINVDGGLLVHRL